MLAIQPPLGSVQDSGILESGAPCPRICDGGVAPFWQRSSPAVKRPDDFLSCAGTTASRSCCTYVLGQTRRCMEPPRITKQEEPHDREIQNYARSLRLDGSGRQHGQRRSLRHARQRRGFRPDTRLHGSDGGTGSADVKQHPPTETMNRVTGEKAASSQDAQKQMQGQPTAAQEAMGAKPTAQGC